MCRCFRKTGSALQPVLPGAITEHFAEKRDQGIADQQQQHRSPMEGAERLEQLPAQPTATDQTHHDRFTQNHVTAIGAIGEVRRAARAEQAVQPTHPCRCTAAAQSSTGAIVLLIQPFLQQSPHHTSVVKAQG